MKYLVMAAAAATLFAGSASASESIHISTVGKTPEQVRVEVVRAAKTLCARDRSDLYTANVCIAETVKAALASMEANTKLAMR